MSDDKKEIKVKLTAGSALEFSGVLADAMEHLDPSILSKAKAAGQSKDPEAATALGAEIIKSLLRHSRHSTFRFLAGTAGMTEDELKEAPLSAIGDIIEQIKNDPDLKDFLDQVRGMLN